MSAPFDFAAWLAATGWSAAEAGRQIGLAADTIIRMRDGKAPVSEKTVILCREASRRQIERLQPFAA